MRGKYEVAEWVIWQMANQGPKLGECGHFRRLEGREGDQSYAIRRFTDEANRLYGVLNNRLYDRPYLAGDDYTIADMIAYPWTVGWQAQGQDINEFKYFKRWFEEIGKRPAVIRGMAVGKDLSSDTDQASAGRAGAHPQDALQSARHSGAGLGRIFDHGRARVGDVLGQAVAEFQPCDAIGRKDMALQLDRIGVVETAGGQLVVIRVAFMRRNYLRTAGRAEAAPAVLG